MKHDLDPIDHESLSNTVYATLCDALIQGRFQPGDRLKIRDLAGQLGTSVTPIRDAILRLAHDEAIVFRSARDIRIPDVSEDRYLEIRSIRIRLEALAAETAAQLASRADIDALETILRDNEEALKNGDRLAGTRFNQAFHLALPKIARLPVLDGILHRIWLQMGPLIADSYLQGGRAMVDYHYPVIDALRRHDPAAAAKAIVDDIVLGGKAIMDRVEQARAIPGKV